MKPYYERSGITIYHGDCREVLPTLPKCDLVLTDPPYSISVEGSILEHKANQGKTNKDFFPMDYDWASMTATVVRVIETAIDEHTRPGASAYVWCGHRQFGPIVEAFEARGWSTRPFVWGKKVPVPSPPGSGYSSGIELCVYAYQTGRTFTAFAPTPSNLAVHDSFRHGQPGKVAHPTQKPLPLLAKQIVLSSVPGDLVLDPFAGSGTTLVAAKQLGRRAIGIELEEKYAEIAAKRLEQETLPFFDTPEPATEVLPIPLFGAEDAA